jgi:hypothetical protein
MRAVIKASPHTLAEMAEIGRLRVLEQHAIVTEAGKLGELFSSFTTEILWKL